jgi:phosphotriesterase-related protein
MQVSCMNNIYRIVFRGFTVVFFLGCAGSSRQARIMTVSGAKYPIQNERWLSHEHILVDFIGADSINPKSWNHDSVIATIGGYLDELKNHQVKYFVDATPAYLGRDAALLEKISKKTGITILTNTGFYGARANKYIPSFAFNLSAEEIAKIWIDEYQNGIDGTTIKPGFIKISVDAADTLHPMHQELVRAAGITHLKTGLLILSHTGAAKGLWPQLEILRATGVSPEAFVWVHAQVEEDSTNYLRAAQSGCWIALDGLGWELDKHVRNLFFAKQHGILHRILISHDAGWYDPKKQEQNIQPYTTIFTKVIPELKSKGFTDDEINLLLNRNPSKAFAVQVRKL